MKALSYQLYKVLLCMVVACLVACTPSNSETPGQATIKSVQMTSDSLSQTVGISSILDIQLSHSLETAARSGVPLYFVLEAKIYEVNPYWFNHEVFESQYVWRIQYNALLRQYSVNANDNLSIEYTLDDALSHINGEQWWELPKLQLKPYVQYMVKVRLRLDTSQLPGAFQMNTFNSHSAWSLSSEWQSFLFQTSQIKPVQ